MAEKEGIEILKAAIELYLDEEGVTRWIDLENVLREEGLNIEKDPRIQKIISDLLLLKKTKCKDDILLNKCELIHIIPETYYTLISQALVRSLVIRDFKDFECTAETMFERQRSCEAGQVRKRDEIHQVTGDEWSVSIVSIDGQKASWGDKILFTLDEFCGPLLQGLAIDILGKEKVLKIPHDAPKYVPDRHEKAATPHNSDHSKADWFVSDIASILLSSIIKSAKIEDWSDTVKHDYVLSYIKGLCCNEELRFSNASYSYIKANDTKLKSLCHLLKAFAKVKSDSFSFDLGLDLVYQLRSMEINTDTLAMIGAVLANGGLSPFDYQVILSADAVIEVLNSIFNNGMGKLSPIFAIMSGVPGMCTESGAVLIIIPGILGMGLFSPKIYCGCSVRGYNFALDLIEARKINPYTELDNQVFHNKGKSIKKNVNFEQDPLWPIFIAVSKGDQSIIESLVQKNIEMKNIKDHSGLSLLHVAATYGHLELVQTILCYAPNLLPEQDMWGRKATYYAEKAGHQQVKEYLLSRETAVRLSMRANNLEPDSYNELVNLDEKSNQ